MVLKSCSLLDVLSQPGIHEIEVKKSFYGMMQYSGEAPIFDRPITIMAFTNRCGSNLLADYLRQTKKIGGFHESLNFDKIKSTKERDGIRSLPDYIEYLFQKFAVIGRLGVKASWDQMTMLSRNGILGMFPAVNIVHIKRSDVVSQAVSHLIARQTKKWTSAQKGESTDPKYDFRRIDQMVSNINNSNSLIPIVSAAIGALSTSVIYESLVKDPRKSVRDIGRDFSLDFADWMPTDPKISRQTGEKNKEFCQKFLAELRSVMME